MPGTIQVSVLEFVPPQQSSSFSEISLKISMGKREYRTLENGDFSFPLINLRDNLIVTLQNAEGEVISHSVIETKLVIEKGVWDDIFPFEGGGHVHMKLQFVLSEEDRHRICIMRQSALKKKHDELLKGEVKNLKQSSMIRSYSASSLPTNKEVSDSHKSLLRNEVIQAILPSTTTTFTLFQTRNSEKETNPNDTDRYKDVSSSSTVLRTIEARLEELSRVKLVEKPNFVEEASYSGSSGSVVAANLEADKQNFFEKNPSQIRDMISAFESSLNQDMKPNIRPSVKNLEKMHIDNSKQLTTGLDRSKVMAVNSKNKGKFMQKVGIREEKASTEDFSGEKPSVSGRMVSEKTKLASKNLSRRRVSSENLLKQKNRKEIQANDLQQGRNSFRNSADVLNSSEIHGAWIFPDGGKRSCITACSNNAIGLVGDFSEARRKITNSSFETENVKEVKEDDVSPERLEKSKTEDLTDAQGSRSPVGKVMRVVIMVGFATLVFFTRK